MTLPLATQIALLKPPASFIAREIPGIKCNKGQKQNPQVSVYGSNT